VNWVVCALQSSPSFGGILPSLLLRVAADRNDTTTLLSELLCLSDVDSRKIPKRSFQEAHTRLIPQMDLKLPLLFSLSPKGSRLLAEV